MSEQATTEAAARAGAGDGQAAAGEGRGVRRRHGGRQWFARNFGWFKVDLGLAQVAAPRGLARTIVVRGKAPGADRGEEPEAARPEPPRQASGEGLRPQPRPAEADVTKAITIRRPIDEVYGFWRDFGNLPRFMAQLEAVQLIDAHRSHWIVKAPTGARVEWDAEIVEDRENEIIVWRALEGADVAGASSVHFTRAPGDRGTEVRVNIRYDAPSSRLGATIARLSGTVLGVQAGNDLRRLKQILEIGEVVHSDSSIYGDLRPHPARPPAELPAALWTESAAAALQQWPEGR